MTMRHRFAHTLVLMALFCALSVAASAQSRSQDAPTPVTGPELTGKIPARDMGDSRLTTYYFAFVANPGDVMMDVSVSNFNGDIDVFSADQLRPKTKITMFPGMETWETSRILYARQRERLLIRIEGRTPNDDPAVFRIRFSGSFEALPPEVAAVREPAVRSAPKGAEKVNSVGTIIESESKPAPEKEKAKNGKPSTGVAKSERPSAPVSAEKSKPEKIAKSSEKSPEGNSKKPVTTVDINAKQESSAQSRVPAPKKDVASSKMPPSQKKEESSTKAPVLSIQFNNGEKTEVPMGQVMRFVIDNGVLTLVTADGRTRIIPMSDVVKVGIQ